MCIHSPTLSNSQLLMIVVSGSVATLHPIFTPWAGSDNALRGVAPYPSVTRTAARVQKNTFTACTPIQSLLWILLPSHLSEGMRPGIPCRPPCEPSFLRSINGGRTYARNTQDGTAALSIHANLAVDVSSHIPCAKHLPGIMISVCCRSGIPSRCPQWPHLPYRIIMGTYLPGMFPLFLSCMCALTYTCASPA